MPDNVSALRVSIGTAGFEIRGFSTANCLVEGVLTGLWTMVRDWKPYANSYEARLLTLTEPRLPTIRNIGCGTCPREATASGSFALSRLQDFVFGDPESWVVSLGDSYISGEAGRWAGNTASLGWEAVETGRDIYLYGLTGEEEIPLCHRSRSAEIFIHELGETEWFSSRNFACSGARTYTFFEEEGAFKPGIDLNTPEAPGQVRMLRDFAREHWVRMIALSIGGNDFSFGNIAAECVWDFIWATRRRCSEQAEVLSNFTEENVAARRRNIREAIRRVDQAMIEDGYTRDDYAIVVQNYEMVIPPPTEFRYPEEDWSRVRQGGCPFWNVDAEWATRVALQTINETVVAAAEEAALENLHLMRVESAFDGHRLCEESAGLLEERGFSNWIEEGAADISEWVFQIELFPTAPAMRQEGLHPNFWGQAALRNCLRQAYNRGAPRGGRCVGAGPRLTERLEPRMRLE